MSFQYTEMRNALIEDIKDNVDFKYQDVDFGVKVYRYGEGFDRKNPNILIQFLPTSKKKFQSVSDAIGKAEGDYYRYGYVRIVLCSIHIYCQEIHRSVDDSVKLNGRILCEYLSDKCTERILKHWENILHDYYASFDRKDTIPVFRDVSYYDESSQTKIYNYDVDVYLRVPFTWDKVPEDYDEESDLTQIVSIDELKNVNNNKTNQIIIRYE